MSEHEIRMETQGSAGTSLVVFLAGMAVGAAVAMLYAPQSGTETRAQLAQKTSEIKDRMGEVTSQVADKATEIKGKLATQARDTLDKATQVMSKAADSAGQTAEQATSAHI